MPIPSHTRYTAPTVVSTVSSSGDPATSAPTPAAATAVAARCPASSPPTAGSTTRCRRPAAIAYAQSAPGVTTNRKDTAQNAATVLPAMRPLLHFQPSLVGPDMLGGKIRRKQAECASNFLQDRECAEEVLPIWMHWTGRFLLSCSRMGA